MYIYVRMRWLHLYDCHVFAYHEHIISTLVWQRSVNPDVKEEKNGSRSATATRMQLLVATVPQNCGKLARLAPKLHLDVRILGLLRICIDIVNHQMNENWSMYKHFLLHTKTIFKSFKNIDYGKKSRPCSEALQ